jgi:predicted RNA-binding protein with PIN domain
LALRVAAEGEVAEPRVPSPSAVRPLFGFTRLSAAAYGRLRGAVDDDPDFRERVAEVADESVVGRAGWLWLTRPEGWESDPAFTEAPPATGGRAKGRGAKGRGDDAGSGSDSKLDAKLTRAREQAERSDEARRRAQEQRAEAVAELDRVSADRDALQARVDVLEIERNTAVRTQKALEADLAQVRRDLKLAREATRQAEAELLARSEQTATGAAPTEAATRAEWAELAGGAGSAAGAAVSAGRGVGGTAAGGPGPGRSDRGGTAPGGSGSGGAGSGGPGVHAMSGDRDRDHRRFPDLDAVAARAAVSAAATAAAEMAGALEAAATALGPAPSPKPGRPEDSSGSSGSSGSPGSPGSPGPAARQAKGRDRRTGRQRRRQPSLPPGLFVDSPEARRHLVGDPGVLVVVDGYNLAREAWSGLTPEEERRRTVVLLEEVAHRSGAPVTVVFDGDDTMVAPAASRVVRVRFSASGVTADDDIATLLTALPTDQPVLVVSTDREVADDARSQGALVLTSAEFLAAIGR